MILKIILTAIYYLLVIAWCIAAATILLLWTKLLKLRRLKVKLRRKDDEE